MKTTWECFTTPLADQWKCSLLPLQSSHRHALCAAPAARETGSDQAATKDTTFGSAGGATQQHYEGKEPGKSAKG